MQTLLYPFLFLLLLVENPGDDIKKDSEVPASNSNRIENHVVGLSSIFEEEWDCLPQPQFWKEIMLLSPDSCLINVAENRMILERMDFKEWMAQTEPQKKIHKDSLRRVYNIPATAQINVTFGKNDFYRFNDVYPSLEKGRNAFIEHGVDPWYAQAILLIESPGQLAKSHVGAYGAFQLMPGVARAQGLVVNKYVDERKDFDKSAMGSARLISRICIPEAKKILDAHSLKYNETDLWFRLFVLHVYHAGAMNVKAVVDKINPKKGGQELITKMWQTSAASFGNSSQNYTQLALASHLVLNEFVAMKLSDAASLK
jgi:hypothetical protein